MKLTVSKSKNSASFYVQKTIRRENGSVTTITIEKLGNLAQVRAKAGGKDPYVWAQEYVDELNRKEHEKQKEIIISYSPTKLLKKGEQKIYNCGYLFLQDIYHSLKLDKTCKTICSKHFLELDLSDILSKVIYTKILYPSLKHAQNQVAGEFIEPSSYQLSDLYEAFSILSKENDFIQSELYRNSRAMIKHQEKILYFNCTSYYFVPEEAVKIPLREQPPLPVVNMSLFMGSDGIPLALNINSENQDEQNTRKPLEKKAIRNYGLNQIIICTNGPLPANNCPGHGANKNELFRNFIKTQSVQHLPDSLKELTLDPEGWHLAGDNATYNLNELDETVDYHKVYYKDFRAHEHSSKKSEILSEQNLIIFFSLKYQKYQCKIRQGQIKYTQNLMEKDTCNSDPLFDTAATTAEEKYDGYYAVFTNLTDLKIDEIIRVNKKCWETEECFRIMKSDFKMLPVSLQKEEYIKAHFIIYYITLTIYRILEKKLGWKYTYEEITNTLRSMIMSRPGEKLGYIPSYTRTDLTDDLHESFGFRTDYEIITDINMRKIIRTTKKKK